MCGSEAALSRASPRSPGPGAGAAGGAGFGLVEFCGARLEPGIDLVLEAVDFAGRCREARLVLTGEGCLDAQSLAGKATLGVAASASSLGVPAIAIVGRTGPGAEACLDPAQGGSLASYVSLTDRFGLERAMKDTAALVAQVAEEVISDQ